MNLLMILRRRKLRTYNLLLIIERGSFEEEIDDYELSVSYNYS